MHCEGILSIIQSKEDSNYLALELVKYRNLRGVLISNLNKFGCVVQRKYRPSMPVRRISTPWLINVFLMM